MFRKDSAQVNHFQTFGEAGTAKITSKLSDNHAQCMMVGYAEQHHGDVYRMWNPM